MQHLNELLDKLGLSEDRGVLFQNDSLGWSHSFSVFNFEIIDKLNKINPDAVYQFNNQPFILFFEYSSHNKKTDKQIFREVWSWDKVPLVFIIYDGKPKVFNAFHYQSERDQLEEIVIKSDEQLKNLFSFWNLQSGSTWKWLEENIYRSSIKRHRVNYNLFNNIKAARIFLSEEAQQRLPGEFANILILRLIFIRYLIDRNVRIEGKYIQGESVEEKRNCFSQLILNRDLLLSFINYLKGRFNGNLFETENDPEIHSEHLEYLSNFFIANLPKKQYFIPYLNVFDFSIIPVETISGIYESVIDEEKRKENSAIYTPLFLVDYILSKTVDLHLESSNSSNCKVLDPSVGSGIFLTQTLKRIIEKERRLKGNNLSDNELKSLVIENLFGIDKDINALHVAAFSIYISILDYKEPKEIDNFQLPNLIGENLVHNDFFNEESDEEDYKRARELTYHKYNEKFKKIEFVFILGNPPWGRKNNKDRDFFHLKFKNKYQLPLSNDEIAQSFLIRSKDFQTISTKASFVITSKAFYNNWAEEFKKKFFSEYFVSEIFDMSAARRMVFEGAISPALILFFQYAFGKSTNENSVHHNSIKANRFLKEFNALIISNQDSKSILQKHFIDYPWLMKVALYGNTYDFKFIQRISTLSTKIDDIIDNKSRIFKGDGILKGKPKKEPWINLVGLPLIESFNKYSLTINSNFKKLELKDVFLESGRRLELFKGYHLLFKSQVEYESHISICYVDYDNLVEKESVFRHDVFGISSLSDNTVLLKIYCFFISELFTYYQFLTTTAWGISTRPAIRLEDYITFPILNFSDEAQVKSEIVKFINVYKDYYSHNLKSPEPPDAKTLHEFHRINKLINETYLVSDIEKDMIDYVLDVSRYQFQEGKLIRILRPPSEPELKSFAQVFFDHYSATYNEDNQFFKVEIYKMQYFIAMKFIVTHEKPEENYQIRFGNVDSEEKLFKILSENLSVYEISNRIFIQRNVIGFEKDWFYLIKPNEYKSWHRAMAHYDIAEFDDLIMKAEFDLMKENE
jgi:hypothetical protein